MAKLNSFTFVTLNGCYKGPQEDISWHKDDDPEKNNYAIKGAGSGGILIFGRKTYEMMVSFWPTPAADESYPEVAKGMNNANKIVFSRTMKKADWKNTKLVKDDMIGEIKKLKKESEKDLTIIGSGSIVGQLAEEGLIDHHLLMVDPIVIGQGTALFSNIHSNLHLKLVDSKIFKSGVLLLTYAPVKK